MEMIELIEVLSTILPPFALLSVILLLLANVYFNIRYVVVRDYYSLEIKYRENQK